MAGRSTIVLGRHIHGLMGFLRFLPLLCLRLSAIVAIIVTFGIVFSLLFESLRFFSIISPVAFLTGTTWGPNTLYHIPTNVAEWGDYGILPLLSGSFMVTVIALAIAVPLGLGSALYMRLYAAPSLRSVLKPTIEILAGIPTIVYGFFALVLVVPALQKVGEVLSIPISPQSALGVGVVMGVMVMPLIASLSDDALGAVPKDVKDSALALGATYGEMVRHIALPWAFPGIVAAVLLAMSRALGETMLVVMAAGLEAPLTLNPLDGVSTVTVQIVSLLTGDGDFDSPKTLSAFALGLTLFVITFVLNIFAARLVRRHIQKRGG